MDVNQLLSVGKKLKVLQEQIQSAINKKNKSTPVLKDNSESQAQLESQRELDLPLAQPE